MKTRGIERERGRGKLYGRVGWKEREANFYREGVWK